MIQREEVIDLSKATQLVNSRARMRHKTLDS